MTRPPHLALTIGGLAAALLLTGCAGPGNSGEMPGMHHDQATGEAANAADEMFATMMIPHHQQAIEMSNLLLDKDGIDQRVRDLAQQIADAQAPEIETMTGWLQEWGVPYEPDQMHGMGQEDGMMSHEDMTALEAATGTEASRLFLEQMIAHHEGAVDMANTALDGGAHPDVRTLAEHIVASQTDEVTAMRKLLAEI